MASHRRKTAGQRIGLSRFGESLAMTPLCIHPHGLDGGSYRCLTDTVISGGLPSFRCGGAPAQACRDRLIAAGQYPAVQAAAAHHPPPHWARNGDGVRGSVTGRSA